LTEPSRAESKPSGESADGRAGGRRARTSRARGSSARLAILARCAAMKEITCYSKDGGAVDRGRARREDWGTKALGEEEDEERGRRGRVAREARTGREQIGCRRVAQIEVTTWAQGKADEVRRDVGRGGGDADGEATAMLRGRVGRGRSNGAYIASWA